MTTHTTIRSYKALGFAGILLLGTCFVLFQDVWEGARITTGHVLTALALLIATASGHQIVPTFKAGRYALTLTMIALSLGAVMYIGLMSGARNAEQISSKAERIEANNAARADILAERKTAQDMLTRAQAAMAAECGSGKGGKCKGREATVAVYTAAVAGHDAKLEKLGAALTANAGYKAAAEGIVLLPWFRGMAVSEVERTLIVLLPWLAVLLAELSIPAFLSLALGHAEHRPPAAPLMAANDQSHLEPGPGTPVPQRPRDDVLDWVRAFRARHGRDPQIPELMRAHPVARTTAWRRIKAA